MRYLGLFNPILLNPPHKITHKDKLTQLKESMRVEGWKGKPLVGYRDGDVVQLISGTHRRFAAVIAGLMVPVIVWDFQTIRDGFGNLERWNEIMKGSGAMQYVKDGKTYDIEFRRYHRALYLPDPNLPGTNRKTQSTNPSTEVTIRIADATKPKVEWEVWRSAVAHCNHRDRFSLEKGRIMALRAVTRTLDKGEKPLLWKAYHERFLRKLDKEPKS